MPVTQPASLWEESGRYVQYGPELLTLQRPPWQPICAWAQRMKK